LGIWWKSDWVWIPSPRRHSPHGRFTGRLGDLLAPTKHIHSDDDGIDMHLALTGLRGRLRLLAGMVRGNRPWKLVPHLSTATAAAAAAAAYGLVTNNFWNMADALSPLRLALINVLAIVAMASWLLIYNHLWERPAGRTEREKAVLYDASTLLTTGQWLAVDSTPSAQSGVPRCIGYRLGGARILGQARGDLRVVHRALVVDRLDTGVDDVHGGFLGGRGAPVYTLVDALDRVWGFPPGAGADDGDSSGAVGVLEHLLGLFPAQSVVE
jgi:hypothetical protein